MRNWRLSATLMLLSAIFVAPVSAQIQDEPPNVYLDVSTDARNKLRTLDSYIQQEEWAEAVGLLQALIEGNPNKLVPSSRDANTNYVNLRAYCQYRLSLLPPEALRIYRQRVDSQAKDLLQRYRSGGDVALLERIVDEHFCSSAAPEAIEILADRATSDGQFSRARALWQHLLPRELADGEKVEGDVRLVHPDPEIDEARVLAKYLVTEILDGHPETGRRALEHLKQQFPEASGQLAGREGRYWEIITALASDGQLTKPAPESVDWPTFAGNGQRSKIAPHPIDVGDVQWKWTFDEEIDAEEDGRNPERSGEELLAYHPVIVGDRAILATDRHLYTFHLDTGEMQQWYDFQTDLMGSRGGNDPRARFTLTVDGDRLFVRTGHTGFASNRRPGRPPFGASSILYCFDYKKERLLWNKPSSTIAVNGDLFYEGAPVVAGEVVYVAATRIDAMSQTSVLALSAGTGEVLWRTLVCEATNEQGDFGLTHNLLTLADGTIYYCSNLGAVAAMSAATGQLRWVTVYPRGKPTLSRHVTSLTPDINPCVFHHGKVFVAPKDTSKILCLDAQTGKKLWEANPPVAHLLGVAKGNLVVTGNRVWGIDIDTGKIRWYWPENTVSSHGRGVLAGDLVYWPTRERIHVLEQSTGRVARPPIELYNRHRLKGGNLVLGDGYVLLAQSKSLLAMVPYSRLIRKLEQELVERPRAAELHMRLSEAALAMARFDLAKKHLKLAEETAEPGEIYERRLVTELARERLYQTLIEESQRSLTHKDTDRSIELLQEARGMAANEQQRLEAISRQADLYRLADRPSEAVRLYQQVLEDPEISEQLFEIHGPKGSQTTTSIPAGLWAKGEVAELIASKGRQVYAAYDEQVSAALGMALEGDSYWTLSHRVPNADRHAELFVAAGKAYEREGKLRDALLAYRQALRDPGLAAAQRLTVTLALDRLYAAEGLTPLRIALLRRIGLEMGKERLPSAPEQSVEDYARRTLEELEFPRNRSPLAALQRLYSLPASGGEYRFPDGDPLKAEAAALFFRCTEHEIAAIAAEEGAIRWTVPIEGPPRWLVHGLSGVVVGYPHHVQCLGYSSGNTVWETQLTGEQAVTWTRNAQSFPKEKGGHASRPARFLPAAVMVGEILALVTEDGNLVGLDADQGTILWRVTPATERFLPGLLATPRLVCAWTAGQWIAFDAATGTESLALKRQVGGKETAVLAGEHVVLATDRKTITGAVLTGGPKPNWTQSFVWPSFASPELYAGSTTVFALIDGYQLAGLDPVSGELRWHRPLGKRPLLVTTPGGPAVPAAANADQLVYLFGDWLECRSADDGRMVWRRPVPLTGEIWRLQAIDTKVVLEAVSRDHTEISVLEAKSGKEVQRLHFAGIGAEGQLQLAGQFALVSGKEQTWVLAAEHLMPAAGGRDE